MEKLVMYYKQRYNNTPMYITENGKDSIYLFFKLVWSLCEIYNLCAFDQCKLSRTLPKNKRTLCYAYATKLARLSEI